MRNRRVLIGIGLVCLNVASLTAARERSETIPPEKLAEVSEISKKADSLMVRKFFEDAVIEYSKALAINPNDPVIHNKLGIAYHQLPNLDMAKKEYERAKKLNPKYHEAWNNLGTVDYSMKKFKRAVKHYKKALQIQPESATTHHNLGAAYFALKRFDEGFQSFQEAYRLDPNILERVSMRGTIIRTTEVNLGIQNFYIAKLYVKNGLPEKALGYLLKALEAGFNDYDKIKQDPDFQVLAQDERLRRMISQPQPQTP